MDARKKNEKQIEREREREKFIDEKYFFTNILIGNK